MEDKIEGHVAEAAAARELDDVLRPHGMSDSDLEAKFARLEGGGSLSGDGKKSGSPEIDDELAALKKKIRIG